MSKAGRPKMLNRDDYLFIMKLKKDGVKHCHIARHVFNVSWSTLRDAIEAYEGRGRKR